MASWGGVRIFDSGHDRWSHSPVPLIIEAGEKVVKSLVMDLQQYIVGKVIDAAAKPLFAKVEDAMSGLDWSRAGGQSSPSGGFQIDPAAVRAQTAALRTHAATMRAHGQRFQQGVRALDF